MFLFAAFKIVKMPITKTLLAWSCKVKAGCPELFTYSL